MGTEVAVSVGAGVAVSVGAGVTVSVGVGVAVGIYNTEIVGCVLGTISVDHSSGRVNWDIYLKGVNRVID